MATPDAGGIVWDDEAPSAPVAAPASEGIAWDDEQVGPPRADFTSARGGSASVPMAQFDASPWERVKQDAVEIADNLKTGFGAIVQGGDYPPEDTRRVMSPQEGFGRELGAATTGLARLAYDYGTPFGVTTKLAEDLGAPAVDPFRRGLEAQEQAIAVNPETMRYQSPRIEAAASGAANLLAGYIPETKIARAVDDVLNPAVRAAKDAVPEAALAGHLGPDAQGVALGDEIAASAGLHEAAASRRAAAEVDAAARAEDVQAPAAEPVPAPEQVASPEQRGAPEEPAETPEATDVTPEEMAAFQRQQQVETPEAQPTPEELAAFERQRQPQNDLIENNASGESAASLEAQHRIADEKAAGQTRALIEPNGDVRPLFGVDAVDTHARPGQVVVQRGIGNEEWTVLSHGDDLPPRLAQARVNATRSKLDELHAEESNARPIRSDTRPPAVAREVPQGSRADRGGDLQQPPTGGSEAGRPELRQPPHEPIRDYGAAPNQGPLTSVKNRVVADERSARGMDELNYEGKRTFGDVWDTARARMTKDEGEGQSLAQSIVDRPRALKGEEGALLSMERARLGKQHREAMADIAHAMESKDIEAETIARGRLRDVEGKLEVADRAARASGYEGGFGLAARRMMTKEDYSLAEMLTEAKVRKGSDLTPKDRARVEAIASRLDAVEKELAAVRAQTAKKATRRAPKEVQARYEDLKAQLRAIPKKEHTICGV